MSIVSLRMNEQEEKVIKEYAKLNNVSLSELFRSSVLEKIENDMDLEIYHEAMKDHQDNPDDISFDDMMKELDLNV